MRRRWSKVGLRWLLGGLFVALAIPTAVLIRASFGQLQAQAVQLFQREADDFARRIDRRLLEAIASEDQRSIGAYRFATLSEEQGPRPSSLSAFPVAASLPGTISYFEVDADGKLSTPLLPSPGIDARQFGVSAEQEAARAALQQLVIDVLARNRLEDSRTASQDTDQLEGLGTLAAEESTASAGPAMRSLDELRARPQLQDSPDAVEQIVTQAVFDQLGSESKADLIEQEADSAPAAAPVQAAREAFAGRVDAFNVDIEALRFNRFATGHFVVFRNVWQEGQRLVQGALIDSDIFVERTITEGFDGARPVPDWQVFVDFDGARVAGVVAGNLDTSPSLNAEESAFGSHRVRLSPPFAALELTVAALDLPPSPALPLLQWLSVAIAGVLGVGFVSIYRMLISQINLNARQRDFVSAVSHELKTPITSIRMYGEMLKSGWADDAKKATYYQYIFDESERLSRLIDNVLHLARIDRAEMALNIETVTVAEIVDVMRSKIVSQVDGADFDLEISVERPASDSQIAVDRDAFMQVVINLVDNAIKYSRDAERRCIEITVRLLSAEEVMFAVRDYGPGLPKTKLKKLFELFYRPGDANTRSVPGTGIGLSLVYELTVRMQGAVDVRNCHPGAEFSIRLPLAK